MKRFILFICIITAFLFPVFSQEEGVTEDDKGKEIDGTILFQPVRKGDKFMKIGLSLGIPLFNTSPEKIAVYSKIYPGGTINLGFGYYILNGFSLGGSLSFHFHPTIAKNLYFAVPISFDMAYTFAAGKWRFPMGMGIGGTFLSYNGNGAKYFALFFRPEIGFYYQYTPEWSFGGDISWSVIPTWYKDKKQNRTANFLNIVFAARYHF